MNERAACSAANMHDIEGAALRWSKPLKRGERLELRGPYGHGDPIAMYDRPAEGPRFFGLEFA